MFKVGDKVMVILGDIDFCGKIGTIHRVDDNFNYPYIVNIEGFNWVFDDTEIILMEAARD